jgi:hypothetical protein
MFSTIDAEKFSATADRAMRAIERAGMFASFPAYL